MPITYLVNETVVEHWTYLDITDSTPLTGMTTPADITFTLHRQSGSTFIASAEAVTFTEIGATGQYYITFTPLQAALYSLHLLELNAAGFQRTQGYVFNVASPGASFAPAFSNAYCSEDDVERWAQIAFGVSSRPTSTQVAAFAESRASELTGIVAPEGLTVTPADFLTVADAVSQDYLRELNAISGAADSLMAKFMQETPSLIEKIPPLLVEYERRVNRFVEYLRKAGTPRNIRTHITAGEVTLPDIASVEDLHPGSGHIIETDEEF